MLIHWCDIISWLNLNQIRNDDWARIPFVLRSDLDQRTLLAHVSNLDSIMFYYFLSFHETNLTERLLWV